MTATPSTMLEIGTQAPDFRLLEPRSGKQVSLPDFVGKPLLVVFSCNHCPYVLHILESFTKFANDVQKQGLSVVMINSNNVDLYADDSPEKMVELAKKYGFEFAYLFDETQEVAQHYRAACTPDFFLFDNLHRLVYRGQYDNSRPGNKELVTGADLKAASEAMLNRRNVTDQQLPSMGCNIKWRPGNEPDYF